VPWVALAHSENSVSTLVGIRGAVHGVGAVRLADHREGIVVISGVERVPRGVAVADPYHGGAFED
jgi:hypothetical protein